MNRYSALGFAGGILIGLLWFGGTMFRSGGESAKQMNLTKAGKIPVLDAGRVKPLDAYARVQLMNVNRRQTYYDEKDDRQQAIRWMFNLMAQGYAEYYEIMVVPPAAQEWLGLKPRRGHRYLAEEVVRAAEAKREVVKRLLTQPAEALQGDLGTIRTVLEDALTRASVGQTIAKERANLGVPDKTKVFRIDNDQVIEMLGLEMRSGLRYSFSEIVREDKTMAFRDFMTKARNAKERSEKERDLVDVKVLELFDHLQTHRGLMDLRGPVMVPGPAKDLEEWMPLGKWVMSDNPAANPAGLQLEKIVVAYATNDVKAFNKEVDAYLQLMDTRMPAEMSKVRLEAWFYSAEPFYQCCLLYGLVLLISIASWAMWQAPLRAAAFGLTLIVCAVHTYALGVRVYLTTRPPITNLYSSAVWIGWGAVVLALFACFAISRFKPQYRFINSVLLAVAGILGGATLIVAHHLGASGDTMEVMQAVLDTNFWLATHVTTVTLGYTATFVAGFLAMLYVFFMLGSAVRSSFAERKPVSLIPVLLFLSVTAMWVVLGSFAIAGLILLVNPDWWYVGLFHLLFVAVIAVGVDFLTRQRGVYSRISEGRDSIFFVGAVLGFVTVPAVLACGVLGGLWLLLADGDPASVFLLAVLSMVIILTLATVYGVVLLVNRFADTFSSLRPMELPPVAAPLQYFSLSEMASKILNSLVYGVICFALLLSFVGTVLGGIWADQSWGRFWGWDPKENGALLIVIVNALILHARWSGLIKERGMCVLALLGNMVTAWSWFGTNQLGVGLHAYGFNNTLALGCRYFWVSQLGLAMFGLMPLRFWRAYSDKMPMTVAKPDATAGRRLTRKGGTGIQPA